MSKPSPLAFIEIPDWVTDIWEAIVDVVTGGDTTSTLAELTTTPATPADAPDVITVPTAMDTQFDDLWGKSLPGNVAQEHGGTVVRDESTGEISLVNQGGGNAGSFPPDRDVADDQEIVGVFHTHPYSEAEGGMEDVSLSGGDVAYAVNNGDQVIIAQSGEGQFMVVRTEETPDSVDFDAMNDKANDRIGELTRGGMDFSDASQTAAREAAAEANMAYYEGKDGTFERVDP